MRLSKSRTISTIAATGAVFAMVCAPAAAADPGTTACEPGQIVIDGQCNIPPAPGINVPPQNGGAPAAGSGDQSGHHY
jgi:hypothetical protein